MTADASSGRFARRVPKIPPDVRLFLAGLALLLPARIAHTFQVKSVSIDGGYYLEVAGHVRDGMGLVSNLSLYHFAYPSFPYPTSVYPLWPTLLGLCARLGDLEALGHWLPLLLSGIAVIAAFLFGRALAPEPMLPEHVPSMHAGHVFALMLALQADFVRYTSLPYTEGLGFALLFLFSWRLARKGAETGLLWAIETAIWLSLMYFARYQLLVVPIAVACVCAVRLAFGPDRRRVLSYATVSLGLFGATLLAWWLHLRTFVQDAGLSSLLRFDQNRASDKLHPIDVIVDTSGPLHLLFDRAVGFLYAWDAASEVSYTESFYTMHWALPLALPLMIAYAARALRRRGLRASLSEIARAERTSWLYVAFLAAGSLLSVHAVHKHYNGDWYFSSRQGLMSLPCFLVALVWLLRQRAPLPTALGVFVLCSSTAVGVRNLWVQVTALPEDQRGEEPYGKLITWLDEHKDPNGKLIVALDAAQVQRVGWMTDDVGYHWISANTRYEDVLTVTDQLGARYVILRERALQRERGWRFLADEERLEADFVRLPDAPGAHVVFERRRAQ